MFPSWFDDAACRGMGPAVFFPEDASRSEAKAVCATCPVTEPCLSFARENHIMDGIWGGQLPASVRRKELKDKARDKRMNAVRTNLNPRFAKEYKTHGTQAGYAFGCRCQDCTEAKRIYDRSRAQLRKASA